MHRTGLRPVRPWRTGGPADIDNAVLLCNAERVSIETSGSDITMRDGRPGVCGPSCSTPPKPGAPPTKTAPPPLPKNPTGKSRRPPHVYDAETAPRRARGGLGKID